MSIWRLFGLGGDEEPESDHGKIRDDSTGKGDIDRLEIDPKTGRMHWVDEDDNPQPTRR